MRFEEPRAFGVSVLDCCYVLKGILDHVKIFELKDAIKCLFVYFLDVEVMEMWYFVWRV